MSFLTRWFKAKKEEDYETILSTLAQDVQKRQLRLSEIRLRERRSTLLVTMYTLAAWVAYVSLWYMNVLPNTRAQQRGRSVEKALKGLPVVVGPILILFVRRIVQIWYKSIGDKEEKTLQILLKQQRTKVEEIKKKTNYYSTRDLLQRYDEGSPANTPLRQRIVSAPNPPNQPITPQRQPPTPSQLSTMQTPAQPLLQNHLASTSPSPFPITPRPKQWYDKVADALLGDDEQPLNSPSSRYALICEKCFTHNGLVKESQWEDAQYICPKCNHFNRSAREKRRRVPSSASRTSAPSTATSPSTSPRHLEQSAGAPAEVQAGEDDAPVVDRAESNMMEIDS